MKTIKRKYHLLTDETYKQAKMLLATSLNFKQITEITGRATGTLRMIKESVDFNDYKRLLREMHAKYDQPKSKELLEPVEPKIEPEKSQGIDSLILDQLNVITKHLSSIDKKLDKKKFW